MGQILDSRLEHVCSSPQDHMSHGQRSPGCTLLLHQLSGLALLIEWYAQQLHSVILGKLLLLYEPHPPLLSYAFLLFATL